MPFTPHIGLYVMFRHLVLGEQVYVVITQIEGAERQDDGTTIESGAYAARVVTGRDEHDAAGVALGLVMRDQRFLAGLQYPERFEIKKQRAEISTVGMGRAWRAMRGATYYRESPDLEPDETILHEVP